MINNFSTKIAASIWTEVRKVICSKIGGIPFHVMTRNYVISRVDNQRHGGRRADRLSDIENRSLALSVNGINPFLCFNAIVYDPSAGIAQHRLTSSHFALRKIFRYSRMQLLLTPRLERFRSHLHSSWCSW